MLSKEQLAVQLAERVMGWTAGPDRYLLGNRRWMPRWRFRPVENLGDALRLLERAAPERYSISGDEAGKIRVRVQIGSALGEACGTSKPLVITCAVARALGLEVLAPETLTGNGQFRAPSGGNDAD